MRIIVVNGLSSAEQNALLQLFSAISGQVANAQSAYRPKSPDTSTLLFELWTKYQLEGVHMPYTFEDLKRDGVLERLHLLTPEERMRGLAPQVHLEGIPNEERLRGVPLEERIQGYTPEEIEKLLAKLKSTYPKA